VKLQFTDIKLKPFENLQNLELVRVVQAFITWKQQLNREKKIIKIRLTSITFVSASPLWRYFSLVLTFSNGKFHRLNPTDIN